MIRRLCIIGVGLIGGSLARALRAQDAVGEVVGCSRSTEHLQQAVELGVIDRFDTDPAAAVAGADLVLVAVPMGAMEAVFRRIKPHLAADAVVTDVGSAKGAVVDAAQKAFSGVPANLVPGHPIAGTERSGVAASFAQLFQQRRVILTPLAHTAAAAVEQVRGMWETAGAEVVEMGVEHHDRVLAATSHLPHILAYATVDSLARLHEHDEIFQYAAGGFRDFTRIASSNPVMWRDICIANRAALGPMLAAFAEEMNELAARIGSGDGEQLLAIFERAKAARDRYVDGLP